MPVPSKKIRNDLFNDLKLRPNAFQKDHDRDTLLDFLSSVWDLRVMPSTDSRFNDAYGDIYQHMVNNDDWDYDFLFLERLNILNASDEIFLKFLETIVSPTFRSSEDEIFRFVLLINDYIDKEGLILAIEDYNDLELPIHKIRSKADFEHSPTDLKKNSIVFHVPKEINGKSKYLSAHKAPTKFPAFVLAFDNDWNDYGDRTSFNLFYYEASGSGQSVGRVKIITHDTVRLASVQNSMNNLLPNKFTELGDDYCSLGTTETYYNNLKRILKRDFESVLFALKDIAFFPENRERFETSSLLRSSLLRYEEHERLARQIRYQLYGYDLTNLYKFKYFFRPPYSDDTIDVNLDFNSEGDIPSRIIALIGKNGTGKTQLISSLPLHISKKEDKLFSPRAPLFSKVIAVSYSLFDRFEIPRKSSSFNYVYCGIRNEQNEIMTDRGQTQRFHNTSKKYSQLAELTNGVNFCCYFLNNH